MIVINKMQSTCHLITCFQISKYIGSSCMYSNLHRKSRFIKKIMLGNHKSKKSWYDTTADLRNAKDINATNKSLSVHTMRRMAIRDKLFMEHITDQMSVGQVSDIINGNIEITHVKITPDFKSVNVFWTYINDNISLSVNEEVLQKCAKIIRHELSQLRVIGIVPPIHFVENKQFSKVREVERKLATIHLKNLESSLYHEQMQLTDLHIGTINQASHKELVTNYDFEVDESHIQLPIMGHDVLGLDHYKIMCQITASLSKSKQAVQRRVLNIDSNTDNSSHGPISKKSTNFLTQEEQQKVFSEFLIKRRIEEKRKHRMKQLQNRELVNNFEEEIESDYEEDYNIDENNDEFEDETR